MEPLELPTGYILCDYPIKLGLYIRELQKTNFMVIGQSHGTNELFARKAEPIHCVLIDLNISNQSIALLRKEIPKMLPYSSFLIFEEDHDRLELTSLKSGQLVVTAGKRAEISKVRSLLELLNKQTQFKLNEAKKKLRLEKQISSID